MDRFKKKHFEPGNKQKAVSFLRTEPWPLRTVCLVLSLPAGTLGSWNQGFDENMKPYVVSDQRGKAVKVTAEIVRQVVEAAKECKSKGRRLRIKSFTRDVCERLKMELSRKTIEEILIANDLFKAETRRRRPRFYQSLCQRIPNGLLSIDGSEFIVWLNEQAFIFNVELGVDVGSFCHTGFSVGQSETAQEVIQVIGRHRRQWGDPVGVLSDHGRANLSEEVKAYLKAYGIEMVPAGPRNPKGNGTDEGAFSQMKKAMGVIRLDTSSPQALGRSVLENLVSLYVVMKNQMGLRKNEITPQGRMQALVSEEDRQLERERLCAHNQRRRAEDPNQGKIERLHFIIEHHSLAPEEPALKRAEHSIKFHDPEAISQSEEAFIKAINRDPRRRNLAYFFGILKNVQQEIDNDRYQTYCRQRYSYDCMLENERRLKQLERQMQQDLPTVKGIVDMAEHAVTAPRRSIRNMAFRRVKEWIGELRAAACYVEPIMKQMIDAVGCLKNIDLTQKEKVLNLIEELLNPKPGPEGVTCIS